MSKTNFQDPGSTEIISPNISGLQEAVGKIEDILDVDTTAEEDISLSEVYISSEDRYRIFQAPAGKRNWVASPAPVIYKNSIVISSGFTLDYAGGAIVLDTNATSEDVFTADATYTNNTGQIPSANVIDLDAHKSDYTLQIPWGGTSTNSSNDYSISQPSISALSAGMAVAFLCNADATGNCCLNWDSKGLKYIMKANGNNVTNLKNGGIYTLRYDGTNFILQGEGGEYGDVTAADVLDGVFFGIETGLDEGTMVNNGSVGTQELNDEGEEYTISVGYHNGSGKVKAAITNLIESVIKAGSTVGGILGTFTSDANATAGQILNTITAYVNGSKITGTMPNKGATNYTPSTSNQNVDAGYHNGSGVIYSLGGDAAAGNVLTGKTFSSNTAGRAQNGTMPNIGQETFTPGTSQQSISAGYHDGTGYVSGDADLVSANIKAGKNIFGVAGNSNVIDTSSGDATAAQILSGKKAGVDGSIITGTMPDRSGDTLTTQSGGSIIETINDPDYSGVHALVKAPISQAGYVDTDTIMVQRLLNLQPDIIKKDVVVGGSGTAGMTGTFTTTASAPSAGQILTSKEAWANGSKITGTMPDRSGDTAASAISRSGTTIKLKATNGYRDGTNDYVTHTDANDVASNIKNGVTIRGLEGTLYPALSITNVVEGVRVFAAHYDSGGVAYTAHDDDRIIVTINGVTLDYSDDNRFPSSLVLTRDLSYSENYIWFEREKDLDTFACTIYYRMLEFDSDTFDEIRRGHVTTSGTWSTYDITLSPTIDTSKAFMFYDYRPYDTGTTHPDADECLIGVRLYSDKIRLHRYSSCRVDLAVHWQILIIN